MVNEEQIILTPNGEKVLSYFQEDWKKEGKFSPLVGKDLIEILNIKGVYPVLTSLKKKGLIAEVASTERLFVNNKGVNQLKEYKTYTLTEKGRDFPISQNN